MAHMATHDALTELANRVLFRQQLDHAVSALDSGDRGIAVLMLDLNKFKQSTIPLAIRSAICCWRR